MVPSIIVGRASGGEDTLVDVGNVSSFDEMHGSGAEDVLEFDGNHGVEGDGFARWNRDSDAPKLRKMVSREERMKWWRVYAMHFLFMWNSRTFEYVSIFLVALAFPKGLFATSIRGITSTVSAMLCASAVGNWIDRSPSRLPTLLITIFLNHAAIVASYCCWLYWPIIAGYGEVTSETSGPFSSLSKGIVYGLILFLDVVHDLSAIANRLSLERDWVPVLVGPITPEISYGLTQVNSVMVRIELIVKLIAPSLLPLIMHTFNSQEGWILLLAAMTIVVWAIEVWCARLVARENPELQELKKPSIDSATIEDFEIEDQFVHLKPGLHSLPQKMYFVLYQDPAARLRHYFSIPMWPASISMALLQLTVLAYSATLITHLVQTGFSISSITVARASGAITGLASTVITPWLVGVLRGRYIRGSSTEDEKDDAAEGRVVRTVGMWGILLQFLCLIPVVLVLWSLSSAISPEVLSRETNTSTSSPQFLIPFILFAFLSLSRVGHYMNSLMVQELGQVEIPASQRSTFAGTEQSFKSLCELCHWAATVVWDHPSQFKWLALGSLIVTGSSAVLFGTWARKSGKGQDSGYESVPLNDLEEDNTI
ncbi:uncharacterized protein PAC_08268 [Phialocephala subalpina]|uniref:Solute carrier family 40 member n=1 Tax=Phialocephala subalpina TaxID=576137 RepID=A0A1L7X028_9HELO|nr:uncharacterized protein PAC_08268 [Phialocephala subalpina]